MNPNVSQVLHKIYLVRFFLFIDMTKSMIEEIYQII